MRVEAGKRAIPGIPRWVGYVHIKPLKMEVPNGRPLALLMEPELHLSQWRLKLWVWWRVLTKGAID